MRRILAFLMFLGVSVQAQEQALVMIGFDGFRWDYIDTMETPNIDRVIEQGFRVKRLSPVFPSITLPCLYSLVTGLPPHKHGVVGNKMYDERMDRDFSSRNPANRKEAEWFLGQPVWEVAEKAGIHSVVYYWVGSEVKGREPHILYPLVWQWEDSKVMARKLTGHLSQGKKGPGLFLYYFGMIDSKAHRVGPNAPEVAEVVAEADAIVGLFHRAIEASGRAANLLVVADHGMLPVRLDEGMQVSHVRKAIPEGQLVRLLNSHTHMDLFIKDKSPENLARIMAALPKNRRVRWYTRDTLPHPAHPTRSGHIIGLVEPPYEFLGPTSKDYKGIHGYAPGPEALDGVCFGAGAGIRKGSFLEQAGLLDVFPLMVHLLGLPPQASDGNAERWRPILKQAGD